MFKKILIANRGEIALRIIRTCSRMNIRTVAIYSDADREAPHVKAADEAYYVGGPRVADSYLNRDRIVEIAKQSGAQAIHPGYGFLSENADFAQLCEEAEITFIGPPSPVIRKMGSKTESRKAMQAVEIPVVPGIMEPLSDVEEGVRFAERIGYPVMLKASAGGGGIGMKAVDDEASFRSAFDETRRRAVNFFGNGDLYIEKFIDQPRHIEVQILADRYGHTVHLWERECSIQRRHQKIVEEAPSVFLDDDTRNALCDTAVRAARSIGYCNAGTIEFLVDPDKRFYFLEMNTRLQVEHPVTEQITGIDLVEQQLRIAWGESLSIQQSEVDRNGHAIEVRIYAEHPDTFYPSSGQIARLEMPQGEGIRHETSIAEGSEVTPYYDPMIAKLIVYGNNRQESIQLLRCALSSYAIEGISTNLPLLREIAGHPAYHSGNMTTNFLNDHIMKIHR